MAGSDWMRIGAFFFDSPVAFLTEKLILPVRKSQEETTQKMLQSSGSCKLNNIKTGIWIAGKFSKFMLLPPQLLSGHSKSQSLVLTAYSLCLSFQIYS